MSKYNKFCFSIFILFYLSTPIFSATEAVRIKDIVTIAGIKENQLTGIGLVTGLQGHGDSDKFGLTKQMLFHLTSNYGFNLSLEDLKSKNVAAVMVTTNLNGFLRVGDLADVTVSSVGDAKSIEGGILLQTALKAGNGRVYAVAHGRLIGGKKGSGMETSGSIPGGAVIERELVSDFIVDQKLQINLKKPDFTTANLVKEAIAGINSNVAVNAVDAGLIEIRLDEETLKDPINFISQLELLTINPDYSATIVIDKKSGIVVSGGNVVIQECSISAASLSVSVNAGRRSGKQQELNRKIKATTVDELVDTLNQANISIEEVISLLEAIHKIGALNARIVIL